MEFQFEPHKYPDYCYEGQDDALNILGNHVEEIAVALVKWHKGDHAVAIEVEDADRWVDEGHRYSGMVVDAPTGLAMLSTIPQEHHETDRTMYEETYSNKNGVALPDLPKTVASMGLTSYESYVEHMVGSLMEDLRQEAATKKKLTKQQAVALVRKVLDQGEGDKGVEWE